VLFTGPTCEQHDQSQDALDELGAKGHRISGAQALADLTIGKGSAVMRAGTTGDLVATAPAIGESTGAPNLHWEIMMEPKELPNHLRDEFERRLYVATYDHALRSGSVGSAFIEDAHASAMAAVRHYRLFALGEPSA